LIWQATLRVHGSGTQGVRCRASNVAGYIIGAMPLTAAVRGRSSGSKLTFGLRKAQIAESMACCGEMPDRIRTNTSRIIRARLPHHSREHQTRFKYSTECRCRQPALLARAGFAPADAGNQTAGLFVVERERETVNFSAPCATSAA
jgi:hypothetical protein